MRICILLTAFAIAGCGIDPGKNPDQVDVSGKVTLKGRPVSDVTLNLQVTGTGTPATLPVTGGAVKGKVTPGRYTWFISEGKKSAAFAAIPEKYKSGSLERQIDIGTDTPLDIKLD